MIPNSLTSIGAYAFYHCTALASLSLPNQLTNIGDEGFSLSSSLRSAYFQGNQPPNLGTGVFDNTAPGFTIYFPSTAQGFTTPTWNGYAALPYDYNIPATPGDVPLPLWANLALGFLLCVVGMGVLRGSLKPVRE
jgi:hypothetical protein